MSNLWVPGSGQPPPRPKGPGGPIPRPGPPGPPPGASRLGPKGPAPGPSSHAGHDHERAPEPPREPTLEELQQAATAYMDQLAEAPAVGIISNYVVQLFELARVYLSQQPPKLNDAALTIDAMNALVQGLEGLLGEGEEQMRAAVNGLRMFFVQVKSANPDQSEKSEKSEKSEQEADSSPGS